MPIKEFRKLLPDMKYFVAHGHECATKCNNGCDYCLECAKNVESIMLFDETT